MRLSRAPPWHFELDIPSGSESLGGWCAVPPSLPPLGYELWEPEEGGGSCASVREPECSDRVVGVLSQFIY